MIILILTLVSIFDLVFIIFCFLTRDPMGRVHPRITIHSGQLVFMAFVTIFVLVLLHLIEAIVLLLLVVVIIIIFTLFSDKELGPPSDLRLCHDLQLCHATSGISLICPLFQLDRSGLKG